MDKLNEEGVMIGGKLVPVERAKKIVDSKVNPLKEKMAKLKATAEMLKQKYDDTRKEYDKTAKELDKYKGLTGEVSKESARHSEYSSKITALANDKSTRREIEKRHGDHPDLAAEWKGKVKTRLKNK